MYMLLISEIIIIDQELPQVGGGGRLPPLHPPQKKTRLIELTISALEPLAREVAHTATDLQLAI